MSIDIYWDDLTKEKQDEIFEALGGENGNYDVFPIATIYVEEEERVEQAKKNIEEIKERLLGKE